MLIQRGELERIEGGESVRRIREPENLFGGRASLKKQSIYIDGVAADASILTTSQTGAVVLQFQSILRIGQLLERDRSSELRAVTNGVKFLTEQPG